MIRWEMRLEEEEETIEASHETVEGSPEFIHVTCAWYGESFSAVYSWELRYKWQNNFNKRKVEIVRIVQFITANTN